MKFYDNALTRISSLNRALQLTLNFYDYWIRFNRDFNIRVFRKRTLIEYVDLLRASWDVWNTCVHVNNATINHARTNKQSQCLKTRLLGSDVRMYSYLQTQCFAVLLTKTMLNEIENFSTHTLGETRKLHR